MIDGCGVGGVFQSPSPEQIYNIAKEVEAGAGVLYLYGNYTGDIMTFDMATDLCDMDDIECRSIVGADDVNSHKDPATRRGVAGIYFMFKAAGARADEGGSLNEVLAAAQLAKDNTRTVGFALTPCIIPEVGHANFELKENEMAMGMGIHGEPGVWNGPLKTSREIAEESLNTLLTDMPVADCEEVSILINGLGATSIEELYILSNDVTQILNSKGIKIYKTIVGEYATSMEMAGASISICKMNDELKKYMDHPRKYSIHLPEIKVQGGIEMDKILFDQIPDLFASVGNLFIEKKEELCEMDARLGDGDLGLTMSKGYGSLPDIMREEATGAAGDIGKLLMKSGMKMSSLVPSTMGFLMSTGIMEGGKALKGKTEIDAPALAAYLTGFAAGVQKRGKCEQGQRTIYDSILPAAQSADKAAKAGASLQEVITQALDAARSGVEATKNMIPIFGKAAVHAAQCEGVEDQGAVAGYYKILGLHNYICK